MVGQIRSGQIRPPEESVASTIAKHRDLNGELLSLHVAAVEILNVIRPIVAVGVTFVAHALHQFPECRRKVEAGDDTSYTEMFVQEVRRFFRSEEHTSELPTHMRISLAEFCLR